MLYLSELLIRNSFTFSHNPVHYNFFDSYFLAHLLIPFNSLKYRLLYFLLNVTKSNSLCMKCISEVNPVSPDQKLIFANTRFRLKFVGRAGVLYHFYRAWNSVKTPHIKFLWANYKASPVCSNLKLVLYSHTRYRNAYFVCNTIVN